MTEMNILAASKVLSMFTGLTKLKFEKTVVVSCDNINTGNLIGDVKPEVKVCLHAPVALQ